MWPPYVYTEGKECRGGHPSVSWFHKNTNPFLSRHPKRIQISEPRNDAIMAGRQAASSLCMLKASVSRGSPRPPLPLLHTVCARANTMRMMAGPCAANFSSLPRGLTVSTLLSGARQIPLSFLLWNVLVCSGEIRVLCDPALPPQQRVPERINVNWWVSPVLIGEWAWC